MILAQDNNQSNQENSASASQGDASNQSDKLISCERELSDIKAKYARLGADFENFKKRLEKDQAVIFTQMQKKFLLPLLDIVDSFDLALNETSKDDQSVAAHLQGFSLIRRNMQKMLSTFGVVPMNDTKTFDPNMHEAVMSAQVANKEPGEIVEVLQKGYLLNGEVLRAAKVTIAN